MVSLNGNYEDTLTHYFMHAAFAIPSLAMDDQVFIREPAKNSTTETDFNERTLWVC